MVVLGPCTFLVTAAVTGGDKPVSVYTHTLNTYRTRGIAGFYHGGTALILRQGRVGKEEEFILECVRSCMIMATMMMQVVKRQSYTPAFIHASV